MALESHVRSYMIHLTRLNGDPFKLNVLVIEQIQSHPDTTITLISGKKLVVQESEETVAQRIRMLYQTMGLYGMRFDTGGEEL